MSASHAKGANQGKNSLSAARSGTVHRYVSAKVGEPHGHYFVRCTASDGSRPLFHLDPTPESPAARKAALATAAEISEKLWRERIYVPAKRGPRRGMPAPAKPGEFQAWFDAWSADREARGFTCVDENRSQYRQHIQPVLGEKHVQDWTAADLRRLVNSLVDARVRDGEIFWKTAQNAWGTTIKICKDAATSKLDTLRVREDNPAIGILGPDRGARVEKQFLYPSEFLQFVSCVEVPTAWRRTVALAVYLYLRDGELRALDWSDVNSRADVLTSASDDGASFMDVP